MNQRRCSSPFGQPTEWYINSPNVTSLLIGLRFNLQDDLLSKQSTGSLRRVMAPKLNGIVNLASHSGSPAIATTIVFSSIAGELGSAGQGNYAAANAAVDSWTASAAAQVRLETSVYQRRIQWQPVS